MIDILSGPRSRQAAPPDPAVVSLPVVQGQVFTLKMPGDAARTVSVVNRSHLWVYASGSSAGPTNQAYLKAVPPGVSSVFPVGATRFVSFRVDVAPDGVSVGITPPGGETISVAASPLSTPAAQDIALPGFTAQTLLAYQQSAANAANVITLQGKPGIAVRITRITIAYSATPTNVGVTVTDGTLTWNANPSTTPQGADYADLNLLFTAGATVTVTVNAAGAGIQSVLDVVYQYG